MSEAAPTPRAEPDDQPDEDAAFFERRYRAAGPAEPGAVPWAVFGPRPALLDWLDAQSAPRRGATALVVACGYGDDAEELAHRGFTVRAFDAAPTAIARCHARFPDSPVEYRTANLFALPSDWHGHDLVVEIQTVQSLPLARRGDAVRAIAAQVGPGGTLFLRASGRADDEPVHDRPWPVSRADLAPLAAAGLRETSFDDSRSGGGRLFHATYTR